MKALRQWLVLSACNVGLLALTAMVNDGIAGWSVNFFLAGLVVVGPALQLRPATLVFCLLVSGLAADAGSPTPPGFLMSLLTAGAIFIFLLRPRLGRIRRIHQIGLAWLLNGAYFAAFTLWALARNHAGGAAFGERVLVDFCLSQIVLLPVSIWFFDLQESALALAGLTPAPPQPGVAG